MVGYGSESAPVPRISRFFLGAGQTDRRSSASARSRCAPRGSPRPGTSRRCRTRAPPPCASRSLRRSREELAVHRLCARLVYRHAVLGELLEHAPGRATVEEREVYDLARGLLPRRNLLGRAAVKRSGGSYVHV